MPRKDLTAKQIAFIEHYAGNATEAAKLAGYSPDYAYRCGAELLQKPKIIAAIQRREIKESRIRIANRQQRQTFWTSVMQDETQTMNNRLRASELLGKSEGDFLDRIQVDGSIGVDSVNFEPMPLPPVVISVVGAAVEVENNRQLLPAPPSEWTKNN